MKWAAFLANVATCFGIPIAILVFLRERKQDRAQREMDTYKALSNTYSEHLRLCLDNPGLSATECDAADTAERKQDLLMFSVVNMLEAAYFLYRDHNSMFRLSQWNGWNEYMKEWCRHPEFRRRWPDLVEMFDPPFVDHIKSLYAQVSTAGDAVQPADATIGPVGRR